MGTHLAYPQLLNRMESMKMSFLKKPKMLIIMILSLIMIAYGLYSSFTKDDAEEAGAFDEEMSRPIDKNRTTMLMLSSRNGEEEKVVEVLKRGANPDDKDVFGQTALTQAVMMNRVEVVKQLLEAGADPNIQRNDGYTPLMLAVMDNRVEIVKLLLEAGANANAVEHQGNTALILAVQYILKNRNDALEIPERIIKAGVDVNHINKANHSALLYAQDEKHEGLIALLESKGAKTIEHIDHEAEANGKQEASGHEGH